MNETPQYLDDRSGELARFASMVFESGGDQAYIRFLEVVERALAAAQASEFKVGYDAGYNAGKAEERRATVERIRLEVRLSAFAANKWPLDELYAILDAEAQRA